MLKVYVSHFNSENNVNRNHFTFFFSGTEFQTHDLELAWQVHLCHGAISSALEIILECYLDYKFTCVPIEYLKYNVDDMLC